jgi:CRISPR-associated protein Cas2
MPMTVVITCNSPPRVRGFLASLLLEISPGVYAHPRLNPAVRKRVWRVMRDWFRPGRNESVTLVLPTAAMNPACGWRYWGIRPGSLWIMMVLC